jgi:methionyl-tRNA formyltransferase
MSSPKIDLYLGGELGLWALRQTQGPDEVARVLTFDDEIAAEARALGLEAHTENANAVEFDAAPVGFSVHYPRVIRPHLIEKYRRIYNLHPGYLPWGRGFYPVFWALWEGTPAGATLHEISAGVDEGPVVAQERVEYTEGDTGGSLHARVREAEQRLFLEYWPRVVRGEEIRAHGQPSEGGSHRFKREFFELKERADVGRMTGAELLKLARCLTFPGFTGAEVTLGGRRFAVRLEPLDCVNNTAPQEGRPHDGPDGKKDEK